MKELIKQEAEILPIMSFNSYNIDTKFGKAKDFVKQIAEKNNQNSNEKSNNTNTNSNTNPIQSGSTKEPSLGTKNLKNNNKRIERKF